MVKKKGILGITIYIFSDLLDLRAYGAYVLALRKLLGTSTILVSVRDYEMLIDITDYGISKRLFLYGTWEDKLATLFEQEMSRLGDSIDTPIAIDIGANIGYYTIMEANALGSDSRVVAIEPAEKNMNLLRQNVSLNGLTEQVSLHQCAIGAETGTATLQLSNQSNLHRIEHDRVSNRNAGSETTDLWSLDGFLSEHDHEPNDVAVIRMDLEGYELEVLQGMTDVLASSGPLLLYIEVHNNIFCDEESKRIPKLLCEAGFEICAVEWGIVTASPFDITFDVQSWDELQDIEKAYSLLARKG